MGPYIALIHKEAESDFGVSFPDFPGCVTAGSSLDEARAEAQEALALHVEGMIEDGEALPEPSTLAAVMAERENRDAVAFMVQLPQKASRTVRVNITLPEDLLAEIDRHAEAHGYTRSGFLAAAARKDIERAA
ncbi:type II toxin-antitoxin system HicB family antitoxin [Zavarzinia sp.]|uniref:type II toxin-antitoxin system HicB family antitoxin n=1 Tax=Zavarzinia sp. TaxID=2027920 RepID=UPI0035630E7B